MTQKSNKNKSSDSNKWSSGSSSASSSRSSSTSSTSGHGYGRNSHSQNYWTPSQLVRVVNLDHSYALPSAPSEKKTHSFPARLLFQSEEEIAFLSEPRSKLENLLTRKSSKRKSKVVEEEVNAWDPDDDPKILYDPSKAHQLMEECEKNVNFARVNEAPENWEDQIIKTGWTKSQRRLYKKMIKILNDEHLNRLVYEKNPAEPLYRRLALDKTAQAVRSLLTEFGWDTKLMQWLHGLLFDNLSFSYLAAYLDILQTLKSKIPTLIERMTAISTSGGKCNRAKNAEALNLLLKRPWDPFATAVHTSKLKKPAVTPVFVVVPSGPQCGSFISQQRQKSWTNMLSTIGKVVIVNVSPSASDLCVNSYAESMIVASKKKLADIAETAEKSVYLVGWGSGAIIAATLGLTERVDGVICLAFPLHGTFGTRADVDDPLHKLKIPTMFVVGDRSSNNSVTDMELFRKTLACINALVVVCHTDSGLRVTNYHQKRLLITQSYVDKCIVDEIAWFINNVPILQDELKAQAELQRQQEQQMAMDISPLIPANISANKRKNYFRENYPKDLPLTNYVTASKLLQQNGNKRKQPFIPSTPSIMKPPPIIASHSKSKPKAGMQHNLFFSNVPTPSVSVEIESMAVPVPKTVTIGPTKPAPKRPAKPKTTSVAQAVAKNDDPIPSKIPKITDYSQDPFTISVATTAAVMRQEPVTVEAKSSTIPEKPMSLASILGTPVVTTAAVTTVASSMGEWNKLPISTAAVPQQRLQEVPIVKPTPPRDDSQILRRIITAPPPCFPSTGSMNNPTFGSSIVGLPKDTTATLSPHPIQTLNADGPTTKRFAQDSSRKPMLTFPAQTIVRRPPPPHATHVVTSIDPTKMQTQHMQVVSAIPYAPHQQQPTTLTGRSPSEGGPLRTFNVAFSKPSFSHQQPQIIRLSLPSSSIAPPVASTTTAASNVNVSSSSNVLLNVRDRPLPTRCTDDSLKSIDSNDLAARHKGDVINPELFHHLKSTLSVSKDKRPPAPAPIPRDPNTRLTLLARPLQPPSISGLPYSTATVISSGGAGYTTKYTVFTAKDKRVMAKPEPIPRHVANDETPVQVNAASGSVLSTTSVSGVSGNAEPTASVAATSNEPITSFPVSIMTSNAQPQIVQCVVERRVTTSSNTMSTPQTTYSLNAPTPFSSVSSLSTGVLPQSSKPDTCKGGENSKSNPLPLHHSTQVSKGSTPTQTVTIIERAEGISEVRKVVPIEGISMDSPSSYDASDGSDLVSRRDVASRDPGSAKELAATHQQPELPKPQGVAPNDPNTKPAQIQDTPLIEIESDSISDSSPEIVLTKPAVKTYESRKSRTAITKKSAAQADGVKKDHLSTHSRVTRSGESGKSPQVGKTESTVEASGNERTRSPKTFPSSQVRKTSVESSKTDGNEDGVKSKQSQAQQSQTKKTEEQTKISQDFKKLAESTLKKVEDNPGKKVEELKTKSLSGPSTKKPEEGTPKKQETKSQNKEEPSHKTRPDAMTDSKQILVKPAGEHTPGGDKVTVRKTRAQSLEEKKKVPTIESSGLDTSKATDASAAASKKLTRSSSKPDDNRVSVSSTEIIELSSDDEPSPRVTRLRSRHPSASTPVPPPPMPIPPSLMTRKKTQEKEK